MDQNPGFGILRFNKSNTTKPSNMNRMQSLNNHGNNEMIQNNKEGHPKQRDHNYDSSSPETFKDIASNSDRNNNL